MHIYIMKTLLILCFVFQSVVATTTTLCSCQQLTDCRTSYISKVESCANSCKASSNYTIDPVAALTCATSEITDECLNTVKGDFCASNPSTMIDADATYAVKNNNVAQRLVQRRFINAINGSSTNLVTETLNTLTDTGNREFVSCFMDCLGSINPLQCSTDTGCQFKRPPTVTLLHALPLCRSIQSDKRENVCACLKGLNVT
uniref:Domain of unknown function DB domain-containing protein n=1 Tax=Panagrellus redivivus TaxID=6233 RepID=A0A7E4WB03_PANRE